MRKNAISGGKERSAEEKAEEKIDQRRKFEEEGDQRRKKPISGEKLRCANGPPRHPTCPKWQ